MEWDTLSGLRWYLVSQLYMTWFIWTTQLQDKSASGSARIYSRGSRGGKGCVIGMLYLYHGTRQPIWSKVVGLFGITANRWLGSYGLQDKFAHIIRGQRELDTSTNPIWHALLTHGTRHPIWSKVVPSITAAYDLVHMGDKTNLLTSTIEYKAWVDTWTKLK